MRRSGFGRASGSGAGVVAVHACRTPGTPAPGCAVSTVAGFTRRSRLSQRRYRRSQRRVWCQHTKAPVPVGAWRWHQRGDAVDQFQRCEVQLICLAPRLSLVGSLRCLATAVHQFASPLRRRSMENGGRARAIAQQPLQRSAVVGDAHPASADIQSAVFVPSMSFA